MRSDFQSAIQRLTSPQNQPKGWNLHRFHYTADYMQNTLRCKGTKQSRDILRDVDGRDDEIKAARERFQSGVLLRVVNLMRAKTASFLFLAVTGGERMNFATPLVRELKSHMAQSTDTDYTDPGRRRDAMEFQRGKDSDPSAE